MTPRCPYCGWSAYIPSELIITAQTIVTTECFNCGAMYKWTGKQYLGLPE